MEFFVVFLYTMMVNSPILFAAVMTFCLIALPGFLIISSVCGIVNVMSVVVPATVFFYLLWFLWEPLE
jgi:hypothetical protein